MSKLRAGVIGCGKISVMHAVSIQKQPDAELVCVCDIRKDRAEAAKMTSSRSVNRER